MSAFPVVPRNKTGPGEGYARKETEHNWASLNLQFLHHAFRLLDWLLKLFLELSRGTRGNAEASPEREAASTRRRRHVVEHVFGISSSCEMPTACRAYIMTLCLSFVFFIVKHRPLFFQNMLGNAIGWAYLLCDEPDDSVLQPQMVSVFFCSPQKAKIARRTIMMGLVGRAWQLMRQLSKWILTLAWVLMCCLRSPRHRHLVKRGAEDHVTRT